MCPLVNTDDLTQGVVDYLWKTDMKHWDKRLAELKANSDDPATRQAARKTATEEIKARIILDCQKLLPGRDKDFLKAAINEIDKVNWEDVIDSFTGYYI